MTIKQSYTQEPKEVEVFHLDGQTDVIIREGIAATQAEVMEEGAEPQQMWECDETQFRYPGILSKEEVESQRAKWLEYANAAVVDVLTDAKRAAVAKMSAACHSAILAGFDLELSDGKTHHFRLELTDQLTIMQLANKARSGLAESIPWHGDNEMSEFFSADDILAINTMMESYIMVHQTYFNSVKHWILALDSIEAINAISYGTPVPEEYQSEVMRTVFSDLD